MAKVEAEDLILQLRKSQKDDYRINEQKKLITQFSESSILLEFTIILETSKLFEDKILRQGIYYGLLGAVYSFKDRELDPFSDLHFPVFQTIREDIQKAYQEIKPNSENEELWLFECFDYGIKNVYYLDWTLYLSKSCY